MIRGFDRMIMLGAKEDHALFVVVILNAMHVCLRMEGNHGTNCQKEEKMKSEVAED